MPPTVFSKNVDLKLIQLVKENPVLYNPRHPKYTDSDTREVTWQKIGDSLSRPAVEFAGIQCQIHFGDFQEDKHKTGFIENLKEYMPEHYVNGWNIEKKVLKEYRKHQGLSSVEAKHLYIKTARALPTYGVTFFLVKEKQKDKKKLVPRLLGINSEAILRLDETSKEILQQWPLTHVKTYHASKGEIFTLNFGDYSDKEYSVKTCDAYKIRDILEAYIDLIRQRMMAPGHGGSEDSSYIMQDNITCSQASMVQHISAGAMKIVDQSLVGPSSIISTELGTKGSQGAQFVTLQQVVVSDKGQHSQQAIKSEIGMRGDMSIPFTRRLNRLNSNSVKIVTLLTEPSDTRMEDSRKIVDEMNADLPFVREGVHETIEKQTNEEEKKKLQEQMQELDELMKLLTENTTPGNADASEAGDAAMRIADVTTQMYFALNSKLKRRSKIISRSRPSFVEDENTQKTVRKASFIAATATAVHSTHESTNILDQEYTGPALDAQSRAEVEASAVDKLGKVNAAIAHYIMAYSDPHNVDYDAAIISMNTINEIMPEYAKDAQALASCKDPKTKEQILLDSRALCDTIRKICSATESEDKEKIQQSVKDYTDTSGRLVFVFSKGKNNAKENEMLDLADEVAAETSKLLMMAQELTQLTPNDPAALDVDAAGVKTADAAKDLITQVQLVAPTIHSPHCQSAVTAAAEGLSCSVQRLAASWKPLEASHQPPRDTDLHHQVMEVARALDRLKGAYSELGGDVEDVFDNPAATQEQRRLKFICSVDGNKKQWQEIDHLIAQPTPTVNDIESEEAHSRLSRRLGQLNAAIASLLAATADREHADYGTAELAINTINELMPHLVQDSKLASANKDAEARAAMMEHIRALCDASRALCAAEDTPQNRSEAIAKFTNASGKLVFGASHRGNPDKEQKILELTEEACQKTSQLVSGTDQLASTLAGRETALLAKGAKCADAAKALRTTAQVTAHSISEPRCQSALLSSVDKLSSSGQDLADSWRQLDRPKNQVEGLEMTLGELQKKLDGLKGICGNTDDLQQQVVTTSNMEPPRDQQKLKFIATLSGAGEQIQRAQKALDKPIPPPQSSDKSKDIQHRLSGRLGELNAAIAALLAATNREEPDYKGADDAARNISELMPYVVQDTQLTCANKDAESRAAMLDLIRELCEASRAVCNKANGNNSKDLSDAVSKFSDASGKLVYVVNPRANALRESQIMGLTANAGNHVSQLLAAVEPLSQSAGSQGLELDARGAAVADAAQALVATAQVVAPSISDPHSKDALLSSIDQLALHNQLLADSWKPLLKDPKHQQQTKALEKPHQLLLDNLEALRKACLIPDTEVQSTQSPTDANKLKFVTTISAAREKIQSAQKALDKPIPPPISSDKAEAVQLRLSGRLGELNAAIAALLNATADRERPDYKAAEEAVKTITELLPHVVQDSQSSCANKDAGTRAAMLALARELCEASAAVCAGEDATDPQALNNAVTKFSEAAGKLVYVVNPRVSSDREREINSLSAGACHRASHLLAGVQELAKDVGGPAGSQLDSRGADMADAAQTLAHTTQVTSASISEPPCKKALLLSIDKLSSSSQQLADTWRPLLQDPSHQKLARTLEVPQEHLEIQLEELKKACQMPDGNGKIPELSRDLQRLQFVKSVSGARDQLEKTQKALNEPIPAPLSGDKAEAVQLRLTGRLGELNAAIAALLNATADRQRPDYKAAEEAVKVITELLPLVVQDTQSTCANKEAAGRAAMLDHIRELCAASGAVCAQALENNPQGLDDAVSNFSNASSKLVYGATSRNNADRQKQEWELTNYEDEIATIDFTRVLVGGSLKHILESTSAGKPLLTKQFLSTKDRKIITAIIVEAEVRKLNKITDAIRKEVWENWTTEITTLFPSETKAVYYSPFRIIDGRIIQASGLIVNRLITVRRKLLSAENRRSRSLSSNESTSSENKRRRKSGTPGRIRPLPESFVFKEINEDGDSCVEWLKASSSPRDLVISKWQSCLRERLSLLKEIDYFQYFKIFPSLQCPWGYELIMDLSMDASKKAAHLLSTVQKLPTTVEGKTGLELEAKSRRVDDAAHALVDTARVTAPTISALHCKQAMLSSADKLSSSAQDLVSSWKPLLQGYSYSTLRQPLQQLESRVEELKTACDIPDGELQKLKTTHQEDQKLQFTKTISNAQQQIQRAQKALDRPLPPPSADKADLVKQRLAGRLGELNAAIAALLTATADREKPDYKTAEQAIRNITELMPHVVQDTQSTCANSDAAGRAAMLDLIRELCEASRAVCNKSDGTNTKGLNDAVTKFADASGKLVFVVNPKGDASREKQIMSLSEEACAQTSLLLSGVQKLSEATGGRTGQDLDNRGAAVVDAAQALLASAQITAPTIDNPHCRTALTSSADQLASSCKHLATAWQPLLQDARHGTRATELQLATQQLEVQLDALKRACSEAPKKKAPAAPARSTSVPGGPPRTALEATKEFLHRLRTEESQGHKPRPPTKASKPAVSPRPAPPAMTDDEKRQQQLFVQSVEEAGRSIEKAEDDLKQSSKSQSVDSAISAGECMAKQARLQRNIALAGVEVASLVGANYADKMEYTTATKATQALPQLMTAIVEDGRILSSTVSDESRRAFMQEMQHMCGAGRKICDAAQNDRENLNDAAIEFGDKSAKLLYIVSNDVDPTLEKEITTRAKAIGDSLARISVKAGGIASDGGACAAAVPALCAAGARAQDAAGKLIYTAKLVAPSIYEPSCQQALFNSADNLSTELRGFTESWQPFASDPEHGATVKELGKEADNLERILEGLKSDVKGGRIGQLREIQKLVVEDTPMRQLTVKIMEDAKKLSESPELTPALKRDYVGYCKRLSDALRALDLTNARCKRTPHDTNKRRELENGIQNLQMILLQSRPTRGDQERSNIVDLNDFIDEVTAEADKLAAAAGSLKVPVFADKKTLENINNNAQKISKAAYTLTHRDCESGFDTSYDNILDVDQFGQECDEIVADIDRQLQSIEDAKARNALLSKILPLTESCNMLRFATKSGISAAKGASLESTLDDLDDIEGRVIKSIVKDAEMTAGVTLRPGKSAKLSDPMASINLSRAVCESQGCIPRAPVTAYIASAAASADTDPQTRNQLLKHLYKLVHLLKTQTVTASQRLATWQPVDHPELAAITQQVLQEIQNPESKFQPESDKVKKIVNESDLTKLLVPTPAKVFGDTKQQEDKLTQLSTKLNSMSGTLMLSIASPESLTRSAHATSDAAVELATVARGCKDRKDPVQCERIEEAVQNMTFTTYGLLKTAELACLDQDNPNARRRLKNAIGGLNQAIRRLMQTASTASPLQKECTSLTLALAAAALQTAPAAPSALPFHQCCQQLAQHQETIHKLKNEQPMSRQEFARSLTEVNDAVCQTSAISSQCAYLISVSEKDSEIAEKGPVDVPQIQKCIESLQDACMLVIGSINIQQAKEETEDFNKRIEDFSRALDEAQLKVKDGGVKATITRAKAGVTTSATGLAEALKQNQNMDKVTPSAVNLLEEVNRAYALIERCPLVPSAGTMSPDTKARCDELSNNNKTLINHTLALVKEVSAADDDETMTWVTFNTSKTRLIDAYDALLKSIRVNGQRAGILEGTPEDDAEEDAQSKTYLDIQVDLANRWLKKPMCKAEVKSMGQQAVRHVIDIATKMSEDLKGSEREEIRNVITETEELLTQCTVSYDNEKYSVLMDRIKELKKAIQRGVVTRVVEDFMEVDDPVADLDLMVDSEPDSQKRAFLLERKIAELLAQLGRVTRTARCVADAGGTQHASAQILHCTEQTELLAPMLVQAAQERIACPDNKAVIDNYKTLLAKYAESISKVRDLCDRAVDPMDFVQTAGDAMQRLREESSTQNDVQKGQRTSEAIIKLANRSIDVSMSSLAVRRDPELRAALQAAQRRVLAATPAADCRASRLPDWRESTAEVLRTTGEVESALGGENIFKKKPTAQQGSNQQIYSVARDLHECVKDWSSRDNEIVAVARRMAVLMARLSEYMETDKKQAVITTSKSIVSESHEVAALARKLAHECTDVRIKTNLLQTCERIPTISAQLKMLTTVKSSTLGQQGTREDTEAMDMLVGNAQSLMLSIQEVVKAAAGASVKIMSQRGPRLRWVRKTYY